MGRAAAAAGGQAAGHRAGDISRYAIPERVSFVDSIERTSVGKINKKKLRGMHDRGAEANAGCHHEPPGSEWICCLDAIMRNN
ncbi:hypothetical protein G6F61_014201 [Rhizopus arrhizus]|nr:hypothetical protein G6F61_014201 [Rhizopus arrhizus]